MATSDDFWDNFRFMMVIFSLGFVTGEMIGTTLSYKFVIATVVFMWACVFVLAQVFPPNVVAGVNLLFVVWTVLAAGAIVGSMISTSRHGAYIVPVTLAIALFAASRYPLFALLLAIMGCGAMFTRFGRTEALSPSSVKSRDVTQGSMVAICGMALGMSLIAVVARRR